MKSYSKVLIASMLTAFALFLTGCGSLIKIADFEYSDAERPSTEQIVTPEQYSDTLDIQTKPDYVAKWEAPYKHLYNPMFFASVNGFTPMNVLIRNSYFTYDLLTKSDWKALDKLTEPTNVDIVLYSDSGYGTKKYLMSAFIFKIEEDYIYLGTAGHCIEKKYAPYAEVMFFDRKPIRVSLASYVLGGKFNTKEGDYAMYRFPTSKVPESTLLKLKEVCYDKQAIENVKIGDTLYSGNIYAKNTKKDYDRQLPVVGPGNSYYDYYSGARGWSVLGYSMYYFSSTQLARGQSGSGIFDAYGNVVGTCSGASTSSTHPLGFYTKLSKLDTLYEKLKNQK